MPFVRREPLHFSVMQTLSALLIATGLSIFLIFYLKFFTVKILRELGRSVSMDRAVWGVRLLECYQNQMAHNRVFKAATRSSQRFFVVEALKGLLAEAEASDSAAWVEAVAPGLGKVALRTMQEEMIGFFQVGTGKDGENEFFYLDGLEVVVKKEAGIRTVEVKEIQEISPSVDDSGTGSTVATEMAKDGERKVEQSLMNSLTSSTVIVPSGEYSFYNLGAPFDWNSILIKVCLSGPQALYCRSTPLSIISYGESSLFLIRITPVGKAAAPWALEPQGEVTFPFMSVELSSSVQGGLFRSEALYISRLPPMGEFFALPTLSTVSMYTTMVAVASSVVVLLGAMGMMKRVVARVLNDIESISKDPWDEEKLGFPEFEEIRQLLRHVRRVLGFHEALAGREPVDFRKSLEDFEVISRLFEAEPGNSLLFQEQIFCLERIGYLTSPAMQTRTKLRRGHRPLYRAAAMRRATH